eukprot:COSAG02_NODE_3585_length_6524_cov_4.492296_2_plen_205_part_00
MFIANRCAGHIVVSLSISACFFASSSAKRRFSVRNSSSLTFPYLVPTCTLCQNDQREKAMSRLINSTITVTLAASSYRFEVGKQRAKVFVHWMGVLTFVRLYSKRKCNDSKMGMTHIGHTAIHCSMESTECAPACCRRTALRCRLACPPNWGAGGTRWPPQQSTATSHRAQDRCPDRSHIPLSLRLQALQSRHMQACVVAPRSS